MAQNACERVATLVSRAAAASTRTVCSTNPRPGGEDEGAGGGPSDGVDVGEGCTDEDDDGVEVGEGCTDEDDDDNDGDETEAAEGKDEDELGTVAEGEID